MSDDQPIDEWAYTSDGSDILGVVPKRHVCRPWNGKTYKAPAGTLLRCPCGQHWYKVRDSNAGGHSNWERVGWLRLRRLRRLAAPPESNQSPTLPGTPSVGDQDE